MLLQLIEITTDKFTHDKRGKSFVGERSLLPESILRQVYDDACDVGLTLVNPNTGNRTTWSLWESESNEEMEILKPVPETIRKFPQLRGYKMIIFND